MEKYKFTVIFENLNKRGAQKSRVIGFAVDELRANKIIDKFLKEHNYKAPYIIVNQLENGDQRLDVGSHSEFFYIKQNK